MASGPTDLSQSVLVFTASEPSTFECSLDGGAFVSCDPPVEYTALRTGWHLFEVRATDRAGNVDPTPAQWLWHSKPAPETDDPG
jgi:hypothetical protein